VSIKTYYSNVLPGFVVRQGVSDAHPVAGFVVVQRLSMPDPSIIFPRSEQVGGQVIWPLTNIVGAVQYWVPLLTLNAKAPPITARMVKERSINFTFFIKDVFLVCKHIAKKVPGLI
jgi:hypothetical protein